MSRENVEIVSRGFELFESGDIDGWAHTLSPDVEWETNPQDPEATVHRGREAARQYVSDWGETLESLSQEVLEVIDAGDHVVAWVQITGRGGTSGVPVEQLLAFIFTLRNGLIVRIRETQDKLAALEAVGLRE